MRRDAALGILAASIMTDEDVLIENLPDVRDINVLLEAIQEIGAHVERMDRHTVKINAKEIQEVSVDDEYIRKSGHLIILLELCLASTRVRRCRFRAAATLAADPLTCISRDFGHWGQR